MDRHTLVIFMGLEDELQDPFIASLRDRGVEVLVPQGRKTDEAVIKAVKESGADMVLAGGESWSRDVLTACSGTLRMISKFGVGYDNIDIGAAKELGIKVTNTPGQNAYAVAEMAVSLMLALRRKIKWYDGLIQNDKWGRDLAFEIGGKTVGLIGFGAIARNVAKMLSGFGCRVRAYDIYFNKEAGKQLGVESVSLDELFHESDVISLHCPLTPETAGIINRDSIARMKDGVFIINTSRGGVLDVDALKEGLDSGKVAGAGLDVHPQEPTPHDYVLKGMDNVILTPHAATATKEAMYNMTKCTFDHLDEYLAGGEITNLLTK
ncbi:MAG: phosphoglycerate dehydrogenase [Oscillospiraceae bacterium]